MCFAARVMFMLVMGVACNVHICHGSMASCCLYICIYVCTYIYIYIYIHTHTHIYIYTYLEEKLTRRFEAKCNIF
jgi:hypothetical protein